MQLISVSLADIEDHLTDYFCQRFGTDPTDLPPATDVKAMYHFSPTAWAQLADVLSQLPWMMQIGAMLSQSAMGGVSTIEQLAALVQKSIRHVVAGPQPVQITPLRTLTNLARAKPAP